jgi:SAM-dependent methyltransferase
MKNFWENRHEDKGYVSASGPNIFFKDFIEGVQPGRVLLPAGGEGTNAVFAASRGWEVNTFDFSLNARKKALELARKAVAELEYLEADIEFHELEDGMYDLIALIHVQFHPHNRSYIHKKLINSLKPGGFFLIEAFSKDQAVPGSGGLSNKEMLYDVLQLQDDFKILEIETLAKKEIEFTDMSGRKRDAGVIRMVAIKPLKAN